MDPITKQYPELTPYQFASNRPIDGIDRDGLEWEGQLFKFIFIDPFIRFAKGAEKYAEGSAKRAEVETGRAEYQNDMVPQHVQEKLASNDKAAATSKQLEGATEMVVATAEVVSTFLFVRRLHLRQKHRKRQLQLLVSGWLEKRGQTLHKLSII